MLFVHVRLKLFKLFVHFVRRDEKGGARLTKGKIFFPKDLCEAAALATWLFSKLQLWLTQPYNLVIAQ